MRQAYKHCKQHMHVNIPTNKIIVINSRSHVNVVPLPQLHKGLIQITLIDSDVIL